MTRGRVRLTSMATPLYSAPTRDAISLRASNSEWPATAMGPTLGRNAVPSGDSMRALYVEVARPQDVLGRIDGPRHGHVGHRRTDVADRAGRGAIHTAGTQQVDQPGALRVRGRRGEHEQAGERADR